MDLPGTESRNHQVWAIVPTTEFTTRRIRLAVTLGDVRGIGPEVVAKAMRDARIVQSGVELVIVGPTGAGLPVHEFVGEWPLNASGPGLKPELIAKAGLFAGQAIERAVALVKDGRADGIVTAPIDKAALYAGGYDYPGHTEMLAALAGVPTAMMLASDTLRVVLATTHLPLRDVVDAVTAEVIVQAAERTRAGLREWFDIAYPRIALCGLNPHCGDHGRFGTEDDDVLAPAAKASGIAGPFPADTVFVRAMRGEFDAVIAPYHDIGMTAIKVASFGSAVNVTLGLPFIRTSPDHGTALDIAGQDVAEAESMVEAIAMAIRCIKQRRSSFVQ